MRWNPWGRRKRSLTPPTTNHSGHPTDTPPADHGSSSVGHAPDNGAAASGDPAGQGSPSSGGVRAWVLLPPLGTVVPAAAPLVVGEAPVRPPLVEAGAGVVGQREAIGRVEGLARVLPLPEVGARPDVPLPPRPAPRRVPVARTTAPQSDRGTPPTPIHAPDQSPASDPQPDHEPEPAPQADYEPGPAPQADHERPPVVHARPVAPLPLTAATGEYVGEPQVPAEPYRAPGWLRHIPEWMKPEAAPTAIPTNIPAVLPPLTPPPAEPVEPPARVAEQGLVPAPKAEARRRRSLGQTRRLGLGAPLPQPEEPQQQAPARTGFPYTLDGLRRVDQPPSLADALTATQLTHPEPPPGGPPRSAGPPAQPPASEPPPAPPQAADVVQVPVPQDIAQDVSQTTGMDVTGVPVVRGPAVDAAARDRGARAFARAGAVFLPDAAGPITAPKARALVAHELVHVAQQRATGRVPERDRALEAEAVAVERRYETTTAPAPQLHHPPPPGPAPALTGPAQLAPEPAHSHFPEPERAEIEHIAETSAHRVVEQWSHPRLGGGARPSAPPSQPEFDREARRQELAAEMLDMINADRVQQNLAPVGHLDQADLDRLEQRLDREEFTGFRPPLGRRGWSARLPDGVSGDTVQFSEVVGVGSSRAGPGGMPQGVVGDTVQFSEVAGVGSGRAGPGGMPQGVVGDTVQFSEVVDVGSAPGGSPGSDPSADGRRPRGPIDGVLGDTVQFSETVPVRRPDDHGDRDGGDHGSEQAAIDIDRIDLEELTARLYERLRGRLRLELLVDRERAGLLTDFR